MTAESGSGNQPSVDPPKVPGPSTQTKPSPAKQFGQFLKQKRNEIIAGAIAFLLLTVLAGTALVLGQEWLKRRFFEDEVRVALGLVESAVGLFPEGDKQIAVQLLAYEVTASDLLRQVRISAIFEKDT